MVEILKTRKIRHSLLKQRAYTTHFFLTEKQKQKILSLNVESYKNKTLKKSIIKRASQHVDATKLAFNSDSYYTLHFREKLALKLGQPEAFLKLNKKAQARKALSITTHYFRDRSWKSLLVQQKYDKKIPSSLFATECEQYQKRARLWLFLQDHERKTAKRKRAKRQGLSIGENRIFHLYNSLLDLLISKKFMDEGDYKFLSKNRDFFKKNVIPVFESKQLFLILIQKATEMSYANLRSNSLTLEDISTHDFLEMSDKWGTDEESQLNLSLFVFQETFLLKLQDILFVNILDVVLDDRGSASKIRMTF